MGAGTVHTLLTRLMIRVETASDWSLVTPPDHARLAGEFADAWGNKAFARLEPYAPIRHAVYHHDDGWLARDAAPGLTPYGRPEAFTRDLVGAYSAFEEIDLPNYLNVRARATAANAADDLYAGIIVSMHAVNLLSEQADRAATASRSSPARATTAPRTCVTPTPIAAASGTCSTASPANRDFGPSRPGRFRLPSRRSPYADVACRKQPLAIPPRFAPPSRPQRSNGSSSP